MGLKNAYNIVYMIGGVKVLCLSTLSPLICLLTGCEIKWKQ